MDLELDTSTLPPAAAQVVASLRAWTHSVDNGFRSGSLRRLLLPGKLTSVCETLSVGDANAVSFLMRDVLGEALSLAAGRSQFGSPAIQAIAQAQAECFVALRTEHIKSKPGWAARVGADASASGHALGVVDLPRVGALVQAHKGQLIQWIVGGVAPSDGVRPSDMTQIGQAFLTTPELRAAAAGPFVACAQILISGLSLFSEG